MTKTKIYKKDGTSTPYFWTDKEGEDRTSVTIYKQAASGVRRMKGVRFNTVTNRIKRD